MIFVDSNVLIDVVGRRGDWAIWAEEALAGARTEHKIVSNHIVLAELAPGFESLEQLLGAFDFLEVTLLPLGAQAAFRAGQALTTYRRSGSKREGILADFLIGAHAVTLDAKLLTRDRQRFASYFPELTLITPEIENG